MNAASTDASRESTSPDAGVTGAANGHEAVQAAVHVVDSLEGIAAADWNTLNTEDNPFLDHRFLRALEASDSLGAATGWYPRYLLLKRSGGTPELIAALPCYLKTNSYGEFVFDWAWAEAFEHAGLDYYPKLVAAIPFTPASGQRFLVHPAEQRATLVPLMARALRQLTNSMQLSSAHCLFLTLEELAAIAMPLELQENRVTLADTGFMPRYDCQYHWHNKGYTHFDDFLAGCTAKRRKTIRRERRHVSDAGLRLERRSGTSLSADEWAEVHEFYCATFDRKWGRPSLTRDFFEQIGREFGDHTLIVFAHDPADAEPARPVACAVMFHGGDTLYGRYWGCRREHHSLHFEACYYQGIEFCIEQGIARFEPGAQGEHKITRGFEPTLTASAHYIAHPEFRAAIADFLLRETPRVEARCAALKDLLPFRTDTMAD
ncbi:MAG: GNAT family N-acetyltransferase [Gammaproteobacteria bacterium]|nr:MAG: GNAT family N-acetyltransferase [Gammaproteobacteria bacterium]